MRLMQIGLLLKLGQKLYGFDLLKQVRTSRIPNSIWLNTAVKAYLV